MCLCAHDFFCFFCFFCSGFSVILWLEILCGLCVDYAGIGCVDYVSLYWKFCVWKFCVILLSGFCALCIGNFLFAGIGSLDYLVSLCEFVVSVPLELVVWICAGKLCFVVSVNCVHKTTFLCCIKPKLTHGSYKCLCNITYQKKKNSL